MLYLEELYALQPMEMHPVKNMIPGLKTHALQYTVLMLLERVDDVSCECQACMLGMGS